ncbi:PAAR domain-containing protein [Desulfomicrobium escambiense]|uniref:PAAR domain-containing protein n=1 Tax=Desulfomicrobium escambiense TaxID=29503 RepID=UPI0003F71BB4|nr:PAAR domain-containing protein [Desulfomicrobium escambiense]
MPLTEIVFSGDDGILDNNIENGDFMPPACRVGDKAFCPHDAHGGSCCAHAVSGPAVSGSPDVVINGRPVLRLGDQGKHSTCCGPNTWTAAMGSEDVLVNGKPLVRLGDTTKHCGGTGRMIEASSDVDIG